METIEPCEHDVDFCAACDSCYCVLCGRLWPGAPVGKALYPTFYWPGKGYVTTGGQFWFFDAEERKGTCH